MEHGIWDRSPKERVPVFIGHDRTAWTRHYWTLISASFMVVFYTSSSSWLKQLGQMIAAFVFHSID